MNRLAAITLLAFSTLAVAQSSPIKSGSTLYIEPMHGYETYLAAAFAKKHVPLIVVTDEKKAEYIIRSTVSQTEPSQPAVVINNSNTNVNNGNNGGNDAWDQGWALGHQRAANRASMGSSSTSISVIDPLSSQVVFGYSSAKIGSNQLQRTAEDCAKHLKEFIAKSEKSKK